jgi:hypothetical protein
MFLISDRELKKTLGSSIVKPVAQWTSVTAKAVFGEDDLSAVSILPYDR